MIYKASPLFDHAYAMIIKETLSLFLTINIQKLLK